MEYGLAIFHIELLFLGEVKLTKKGICKKQHNIQSIFYVASTIFHPI
jgi:hypothetical protein